MLKISICRQYNHVNGIVKQIIDGEHRLGQAGAERRRTVATSKNKQQRTEKPTPKVNRFISIKDWKSGGGQVLEDLKAVTGTLAEGAILPQLAGDARRDYVQLLLARPIYF